MLEYFLEKKVRRMDLEQKNDKTGRVRGLGSKARVEIAKGCQSMTALRFQTRRDKPRTSRVSLQGGQRRRWANTRQLCETPEHVCHS